MIRFLLISLFPIFVYALNCEKRLFDISIYDDLRIEESLKELANYCTFSVVIKDKLAKEKLNKTQNIVNIKQMSLEEVLKLFFNRK